MSDNIAIKVDGVSKTFRLPHEKNSSIKNAAVNFYKRKRTFEVQKALEDISFEIKKGEFFGIVGRNGSGKSTLLKLLAGIYTPTKGTVQVNGSLTPFIELGVGFNPELTGRENIFLNGALLGFNRKEMLAMYDDIVEFAELQQFMDQKLKNYSSGMQVRLAFSIAIRAKSDILLIDEVLAVGDAAFQQKCLDSFVELKKRGITILLVTHDMNSVLQFCDKAILLENGKLIASGQPSTVTDDYLSINYKVSEEQKEAENKTGGEADKKKPTVNAVKLVNTTDREISEFEFGTKVIVEVAYSNPKTEAIHFGFQIFNESGTYCFGTNSKISGEAPTKSKSGKVSIDVSTQLVPGTYFITVATMNESATIVHDYKSKIKSFRITKNTQVEGIAMLPYEWHTKSK